MVAGATRYPPSLPTLAAIGRFKRPQVSLPTEKADGRKVGGGFGGSETADSNGRPGADQRQAQFWRQVSVRARP